jgi:hypothetical protein
VRSSEHERLRLGPVELSDGEKSASIHLEFDCAKTPGAGAAHCVIASGFGAESRRVMSLLGAWIERAGVRRQSQLPGCAQRPAPGAPARPSGALSGTESSDTVTPLNE